MNYMYSILVRIFAGLDIAKQISEIHNAEGASFVDQFSQEDLFDDSAGVAPIHYEETAGQMQFLEAPLGGTHKHQ